MLDLRLRLWSIGWWSR